MLQINEFNQGDLNCLWEVWRSPNPLAQKSCSQLLHVLGYESRQEKLIPFILEEKTHNN